MRIIFDGTSIFDRQKMGLSTYCYEIIKSISEIDGENEYFLGVRPSRWMRAENVFGENVKLKRIVSVDLGERFMPIGFTLGKFDVYHGLSNKLCLGIPSRRYAITLHDTHGAKNRAKRMCEVADIVITVSHFSKRRIAEELGTSERKIMVVYNGVSSKFYRKEKHIVEQKRKEFSKVHGGDGFVLCVITDDTYKNVDKILSVTRRLLERNKDLRVIFVGKDVRGKISQENRGIVHIGYVTAEVLCDMYNMADVMFFPAVSGGFGLPVVEAMACGCPVVTSRNTAQDEIGGDACLRCDPNSEDEMLEALEKILRSDDVREELIRKGSERAKLFSWRKAAEELLKIYREIS